MAVRNGLDEAGLERFAQVAASHVAPEKVPGLVALVAVGDEVHVEALGSLSIGGAPVRPDSLFRIGSITKPMTGALVLSLVEEGLLSLDEPIGRLLPELQDRPVLRRIDGPLDETVPAERPPTIRELFAFTFGFGGTLDMYRGSEPWPITAAMREQRLYTVGFPDLHDQPEPDAWVANLATLPLMAQPGTRFLYNTGASLLGVVAARAAREPFTELLRTRIFEPLGMTDTAMWTSKTERLATAYQNTPDGLRVWDPPVGQWSSPPSFGDGSAALVSTASDVLAFSRMLLRGGSPVLSEATVREMTRDQLSDATKTPDAMEFLEDRSWGLCLSVVTDGPAAGAFGWNGGFGTSWLADPSRDLTVVVLTQRLFELGDGRHTTPAVHRDLQAAALESATVARPVMG